jgi:hypothetical protein
MLLGQIVAISFATNLFLLTLLVSPPPQSTPPTRASRRKWLGPWLVELLAMQITFAAVHILSDDTYWNRPGLFMSALMAPHVVLMVMPLAHALLPATFFAQDDINFVDKAYDYMRYVVFLVGSGRVQATAYKFFSHAGMEILFNTLFEHPAVSSVGFDAIFCWITWLCWWAVRGDTMVPVQAQPAEVMDAKLTVGNGGKNVDFTGQD